MSPYLRAHTCFNILDLPLYSSKAQVEQALRSVRHVIVIWTYIDVYVDVKMTTIDFSDGQDGFYYGLVRDDLPII